MNEIQGLLREIGDVTSRTDERVKAITENQQEMNIRLNRFIDEHNVLTSRVHVLESKNGHKFQEMVITQDEKIIRLMARLEMIETSGTPKQQEIKHELVEMKSDLKELHHHRQNHIDRIRLIFGLVFQGIFYLILAYVLWRLGLTSPIIPSAP